MAENDRSVERVVQWLNKPLRPWKGMGPHMTRFGFLVLLTVFFALLGVAIYAF